MTTRLDFPAVISAAFAVGTVSGSESVCLLQTEMAFRRAAWERNVRLVLRHNLEASEGKHGFTVELNHLADMVRRSSHFCSGLDASLMLDNICHHTLTGSSSSQQLRRHTRAVRAFTLIDLCRLETDLASFKP